MKMNTARIGFLAFLMGAILLGACDHRSKLTLANYNQITTGMSKGQVQNILGPPTSMETKNLVLFAKTTWRYEDGQKFALLTFKNDQLDSKDTNLGTR
jgi:outer membrane protein assembly factor BamE (lipoprotein component of BamABCDE complex)